MNQDVVYSCTREIMLLHHSIIIVNILALPGVSLDISSFQPDACTYIAAQGMCTLYKMGVEVLGGAKGDWSSTYN